MAIRRAFVHFWLAICLLPSVSQTQFDWKSQTQAGDSAPAPRLPIVDDEEAWQLLPKPDAAVTDLRLPVWARTFARPLPRTTAAMLELDYLYRTNDAFDPRLRAKMRWVAARANQCAYSQRYAEADLLRLGMSPAEVANLEASFDLLPPREQTAIRFARTLTVSGDAVTDEEVAELVAAFGEPAVVAMVLQIAYANFQDRLLLTIHASVEPEGPLAPLNVRFPKVPAGTSIAAPRQEFVPDPAAPLPTIELGKEWTSLTYEQLVRGMNQQRARPGRVSVPLWNDIYSRLPAGMYSADKPVRIKWSLVVMGHQPQMGPAWLHCLRTFGREANQDRVFEESLFWVITRTIHCFY
jgi:alkylhydroperoxidase family enzyme